MVNDVLNAFIQAPLVLKKEDDHVIMKITGVLASMLVEQKPTTYKDLCFLSRTHRINMLDKRICLVHP